MFVNSSAGLISRKQFSVTYKLIHYIKNLKNYENFTVPKVTVHVPYLIFGSLLFTKMFGKNACKAGSKKQNISTTLQQPISKNTTVLRSLGVSSFLEIHNVR